MVLLENLALCYIALAHQLFQGWMEKYACKSKIDFQTLCFSLSTLKFQKVFFDKMADMADA